MKRTDIQIGLEVCAAEPPPVLKGARFGLLMNQASVNYQLKYACDVLADVFPGRLAAVFSPQHGLWGEQQDNMIETPHGRYAPLDIPIYSLYSDTRRPTPDMLAGLDCFVADLQDVGTRVYTYIWTVSHCLEACSEAGIPVVILDRPNPLGGEICEGPPLEPEMRSFIGRAAIPMRHGLTMGELALLVNDELAIGAQLEVVRMRGWARRLWHGGIGRHWVPPSPNMPRPETATVYPGQVLIEGTNLSEGRGTTTPFELAGAPFVSPDQLVAALASYELDGVKLMPVRFKPTFNKWKGESCGGLALHVLDRDAFRPYRTTLAVLASVQRLWPSQFRWLDPPYEYETEKPPIDILTGSTRVRETIDGGQCATSGDLDRLAELDLEWWDAKKGPHLLY